MIEITEEYLRSQALSPTFAQRFWSKVDKSGGPDACWPFKGFRNSGGYGIVFTKSYAGPIAASRASWILSEGPIPEGVSVLHDCPGGDNPACCNPKHLYLGDHSDNGFDAFEKGQHISLKGDDHPHAKLTSEQVREIRRRYASGDHGLTAMAKEFGVSKHQIFMIVSRRKWTSI